ncbi:MAG: hypothetical protein DI539_24000 [Flavobacterium psychrophilum]|nr:MAG: hypothetical protein DI539_24000 [Flavobacterium psychrophilum]
MARNISKLIKLQGTILGLTFVNSKRYKPHVRPERGTFTPITINKTFKESKKLLMRCNKRARVIFNALRDEHRDGELWSTLVSKFFKQAKEGLKPDVKMFAGLECHTVRTLDALTQGRYQVDTIREGKKLRVTVVLEKHPSCEDVKQLTGYHLNVIVLYPNFTKDTLTKEVAQSALIPLDAALAPVEFELPAPSAKAPYILLLGIMGMLHKQHESRSFQGLAVVGTS